MTPPITEFSGANRFLSNFWLVRIEWDGLVFPSVEHAYQAAKFPYRSVKEEVRDAPTPGAAKRLGRRPGARADWDTIKDSIMLQLVRRKFEQHNLREALLETGDAELIEGNAHRDKTWGAVLEGDQWVGENRLGKILMKVREELRHDG